MRSRLLVLLVAILGVPEAGAQNASGTRGFTAEAAGGVLGSVAGVVVGLSVSKVEDCGDDIKCTIEGLGVTGITSVIGATAGVIVMGRSVNSRPSAVGAFLGSIAGAAAGVALVHGMTEEVNLKLDKPTTVVVYSIAQGVLAAAGSRLAAALR